MLGPKSCESLKQLQLVGAIINSEYSCCVGGTFGVLEKEEQGVEEKRDVSVGGVETGGFLKEWRITCEL